MINELYERELRNTSINGVSLADYVKENYILKSVIEDIIAEIMQYMFFNGFGSEYQYDMRKIIEKHISGKKNCN